MAKWKAIATIFWKRSRIMTRLYESWSERADMLRDENERLKAEIKEARNEAATVRRAYLHEKNRAEKAICDLQNLSTYANRAALDLSEHGYRVGDPNRRT